MRVSQALVVLGIVLAASAGPALGDPVAAVRAGPPPWPVAVRARVAHALASIRGTAARGRLDVAFTVTGEGDIVDVHVEGAPRTAARAAAVLQRLGRGPAPPDLRSHAVRVGVTFR